MTMRRVKNVIIADTARVIGQITLGDDVNVWYGATIRADIAKITIGPRTNVQENAVIHVDWGHDNHIGADITIGHGAIVHGYSIGDGTLIGMGAVLLNGTRIGKRCLIGAGAVVPPGMEVPDESLVMGLPGRVIRPISEKEREYIKMAAAHYVENSKLHADHPDDPRVKPWS